MRGVFGVAEVVVALLLLAAIATIAVGLFQVVVRGLPRLPRKTTAHADRRWIEAKRAARWEVVVDDVPGGGAVVSLIRTARLGDHEEEIAREEVGTVSPGPLYEGELMEVQGLAIGKARIRNETIYGD